MMSIYLAKPGYHCFKSSPDPSGPFKDTLYLRVLWVLAPANVSGLVKHLSATISLVLSFGSLVNPVLLEILLVSSSTCVTHDSLLNLLSFSWDLIGKIRKIGSKQRDVLSIINFISCREEEVMKEYLEVACKLQLQPRGMAKQKNN